MLSVNSINPRVIPLRAARWVIYPLVAALAFHFAERIWQRHHPYNGFALDPQGEPSRHIEAGGPGPDDIPALHQPRYVASDDAHFVTAHDYVLGIEVGGEARAYPIRILNWHEVVNDRIGTEPVLITWCPLCMSGVAFKPAVDGMRLRFGVSGLLYRGNLVMYDLESRSLWSQLAGEAISGRHDGRRLDRLAVEHVSWASWRERHPNTTVLSPATGFKRDYAFSPYADLHERARLAALRAQAGTSDVPDAHALVIGIEHRGRAKAWPLLALALHAPAGEIEDTLAGRGLRIRYDAIDGTAIVRDEHGAAVASTLVYWSTWREFHPDTLLWRRDR